MGGRFRFFVFVLLFFLVGSATAQAGACKWNVKGKITFLDDLFSTNKNLPLAHAKVKIWASVLDAGGWNLWGTVRTGVHGEYHVQATPAMSGSLWCDAKRRFKVKIIFANSKIRILDAQRVLSGFEIADRAKWRSGRTVTINYHFDDLVDNHRKDTNGHYVTTRAAQIFYGYRKIFRFLERNGLEPRPFTVVWPSESGSPTIPRMWSPPTGRVIIPKSEFWSYDESRDKWTYVGAQLYSAKDHIHELLHQWFHDNVYVPNYLVGDTLGSHDFLESPALSFYEALPEIIAVAVDQDIFESSYNRLPSLRKFSGIYNAFRAAKKDSGEKYYTKTELDNLIHNNSAQWKHDLYRSEYAVQYYLALLMNSNWPLFNPNDSVNHNLLSQNAGYLAGVFDCSDVQTPFYTAVDLLRALKRWRSDFGGIIPAGESNLIGFYNSLARHSAEFVDYRSFLLKLGNPHYANKIWGWDVCEYEPPGGVEPPTY